MRLPCVALAIFTLFGTPALAQTPADSQEPLDSFRMYWTKSSETDFVTGFAGDFDASKESNYLIGANLGRQFSDTLFGLPIPMTANVGLQYVNERGYQPDIYGVTAFIKAHYDVRVPWTQKKIRLGLGEGLSYLSRVPMSEQRDFAKKGAESEKLLNYLEWTIDLPLRQFPAIDSLIQGRFEELNVGFIVFHRSSVFGIFAESKGGVNFMGFGVEARF
jgi:outer membrane protein